MMRPVLTSTLYSLTTNPRPVVLKAIQATEEPVLHHISTTHSDDKQNMRVGE